MTIVGFITLVILIIAMVVIALWSIASLVAVADGRHTWKEIYRIFKELIATIISKFKID